MPFLQVAPDRQLFYQSIKGDTSKPCLVFLHEGLGCTQMWGDFPTKLCRESGCPGLVYDRLGYGKSSPLKEPWTIHYLHEYALVELPVVLDHLIPGQPRVLIGHSDGGSIGLIYAAHPHPSLRGLITEAAHVFVERETIAGIVAAVAAWENGDLRGLFRYHGENTRPIFRAWSETWRSERFQTWNLEHLLSGIEAPILALQGADDRYGTQKQLTSIAARSGGNTESVLLENCAHTPHQEARTQVLQLMSDFVRTLA